LVTDILKIFQKRLFNLTAKNKSLYLSGIIKSQFLDITNTDFLENKPAINLIENLVARQKKITIGSNLDSRHEATNRISRQLWQISRTERSIFEECGAEDLYVGYPFVQGRMLDDTPVRCPLLFFPVSLSVQQGKWCIELHSDTPIIWNKTFLLAYAHYNQIPYQEDFWEDILEEIPRNLDEFLLWLYKFLENSPLELNFNVQTFEKRLYPFAKYTQKEFAEITQIGKLLLVPQAVLGIFSQTASYLMPDYEQIIQLSQIHQYQAFDRLLGDILAVRNTINITEKDLLTPFRLDAWQEEAIKRVKTGESLVVQGPPGSGKSELICNLIADAIASQKKVLVVCQKRAALDVVHNRLTKANLHTFTALLHDIHTDRTTIFEQLAEQIASIEYYQQQNISLDAIKIERDFDKICTQITDISAELAQFKKALYDTSICGISIKELYLQTPLTDIKPLPRYQMFRFDSEIYQHLQARLISYFTYLKRFGTPHQWHYRTDFSGFTQTDYFIIQDILQKILPQSDYFKKEFEKLLSIRVDDNTLSQIGENQPFLEKWATIICSETVFRYFQIIYQKEIQEQTLALFAEEILKVAENHSFASLHINENFASFENAIKKAIPLSKFGITAWLWQKYSPDFQLLKPYLNSNISLFQALQQLQTQIANHFHLKIGLETLAEQTSIDFFPKLSHNDHIEIWLDDFKKWYEDVNQAIQYRKYFQHLYHLVGAWQLQNKPYSYWENTRQELAHLAKEWCTYKKSISRYITEHQFITWTDSFSTQPNLLQIAQQQLQHDFEALCQADKLKNEFSEDETFVINHLIQNTDNNPETVKQHFEISLRLAWIEHIERQYPELRIVDSGRIDVLEQELIAAVQKKQAIALDMVLMKARQHIFQDLAFNRLGNRTTYREVEHQVRKKRAVWTLRKLLTNLHQDVLKLTPCWLTSPETVSAVFPLSSIFDIVIFDEASQCFAEKGIPAMFRAKQVVICGDKQQLAPFDLYKPRWEEDLDENLALEADSLLDLAEQHFPQVMLQGHYRSQSLALIDFSNQYFYKGKLTMLPRYHTFKIAEPAIKYIKVNGIWEDNTNPTEAQYIVNLVASFLKEDKKDIGIITFNYKQQNLIEELLAESGLTLPQNLFVKNIENVQGDERDYIIFSVGYAPTASGRFTMNFGSLTQPKGENRLNVAITRARKQIWLITSILPSDLRDTETSSKGVKIFKQYLYYALDVSENKYSPFIADLAHAPTWYLKHKLSAQNPQLKPYFPFADLTEYDHDQPVRLWLTDDDLYYNSLSQKDAHAYQLIHFQEKDWNYKRVFSRQYRSIFKP